MNGDSLKSLLMQDDMVEEVPIHDDPQPQKAGRPQRDVSTSPAKPSFHHTFFCIMPEDCNANRSL